jgi:hypothetical protein
MFFAIFPILPAEEDTLPPRFSLSARPNGSYSLAYNCRIASKR